MTEAHQPRGVVAALRALDELPRGDPLVADLLEHLDHLLIGAAVVRPQSALMPAETQANRFTIDEPTSRTVLVEQFCS